ncbi:MAG: ubiquinol-cytochrome C chaperone family protein [Geminicoccaceae bacterium]
MTTRKQETWPVSRGLFGRFSGWLGNRRADRRRLAKAFALYHGIVARAREPRFYAEWGVPDTPDGRLELIFAHTALVMRRLRAEGEAGSNLAQDLFDVLFADVDRNIREQGVGDLSVGKHVKRSAQTFLARAQALDVGLDAGDRDGIARILDRNIHNRVAADEPATTPPDGMLQLAAHLQGEAARLERLDGAALLAGQGDPAAP